MTKKDKVTEEKQTKQDTQETQGKPDQTKEQDKPRKQDKQTKPDQQEQRPLDEPIKVKDYIYLNILTLEGKAWAYMDLIAHPETQKHLKDTEQAKLAIDTINTLYTILEPHLTDDQKKDLQTRLTNLRLNYAK